MVLLDLVSWKPFETPPFKFFDVKIRFDTPPLHSEERIFFSAKTETCDNRLFFLTVGANHFFPQQNGCHTFGENLITVLLSSCHLSSTTSSFPLYWGWWVRSP